MHHNNHCNNSYSNTNNNSHHTHIGFSFLAPSTNRARILLLGTMPGTASLNQNQYYGHPQNKFWKFMELIFGISRSLPYAERTKQLTQRGIVLWDVIHQCSREGSLDSAIKDDTIKSNNFPYLFQQYPQLKAIFFNGQNAARYYKKLVLPIINKAHSNLPQFMLPSTSPANARTPRYDQLEKWKIIVKYL